MQSDTVCNSEHLKYNKPKKIVVKCAENNLLCWASSEQSSTTKNIISFLSQMLNSAKLPEGCVQVPMVNFAKQNHKILKVESYYFEGKELRWLSIVAMYVQLKLNKKEFFPPLCQVFSWA